MEGAGGSGRAWVVQGRARALQVSRRAGWGGGLQGLGGILGAASLPPLPGGAGLQGGVAGGCQEHLRPAGGVWRGVPRPGQVRGLAIPALGWPSQPWAAPPTWPAQPSAVHRGSTAKHALAVGGEGRQWQWRRCMAAAAARLQGCVRGEARGRAAGRCGQHRQPRLQCGVLRRHPSVQHCGGGLLLPPSQLQPPTLPWRHCL